MFSVLQSQDAQTICSFYITMPDLSNWKLEYAGLCWL